MTIGKNIKRLRQNKGVTQEQLAESMHISGQAVSKWENGTALPDITLLPLLADSRGRMLCGYTLQDGDKVIVVDDLISSGQTLSKRLDNILELAKVEIAAVVVIADRMICTEEQADIGSRMIEEKYHTKVYSIITEDDIENALKKGII